MQQEQNQQPTKEQSDYFTLKEVEQEVGLSRGTLRKYLNLLGIQPKTWSIGNRSLYITRDEKERVRKLKDRPRLLEQLRSPLQPTP